MKHIGGSVLVAALLALTACTGGNDDTDTTERDDTTVEPAWTLDLDLFTTAAVADGVAVALTTADGGRLEIVAVDAASGEELWTRPWSPGNVPVGFTLTAETFEGSDGKSIAVFSEPAEDEELVRAGAESVIGVDLQSGEELFRTDPVRLGTPIQACGDDLDACFDPVGSASSRRLDVTDGSQSDDPDGPPEGARSIGSAGLFSTNDRPGEKIGVRRDGKVLWSAAVEELFDTEGISTDTGWNLSHTEDPDVYIGWLRLPLGAEQSERQKAGASFTADAGGYMLAEFEGGTGKVLWRERGTMQSCLGGTIRVEDELPRMRCRPTGTISYGGDGTRDNSVQDAGLTMEGFDPATGETTWSLEVPEDAAAEILLGEATRPVSDGATVVIPTADGPQLVEIATGETAEVEEADVFACRTAARDVEYFRPWRGSGAELRTRYGTELFAPCHADGSAADAFTVAAVKEAGEDAGDGRWVVAREGRLEGYVLD